ncbi:Shortchain dehydrogenase, variant 2 [Balamuthia mandrillaris]
MENKDLPHGCGRACMCCKTFFTNVHKFYDKFCPTCAALFWEKRMFRVDLTGRVALVTGGRIKIGYETALILLRCNATVIVTTRFPRDAAIRFAKEKDFANWKNNLRIYRLDMRSLPLVEGFIAFLYRTLSRLDILINNAAQTIARPPEFFSHLHQLEQAPIALLSPAVQSLLSTSNEWNTKAIHSLKEDPSSSLPTQLLPASVYKEKEAQQKESTTIKKLENDLVAEWSEPIDLRQTNSWMLRLEQVSTKEFLEVQLVNNVAPFLLTARLKDLMQRSPPLPKKEESRDEDKEENETGGDYHEKVKDNEQNEEDVAFWKFIINVSAMEGQFYRYKTERHPHTNMAKASLNMMTRTAAADYAVRGILMNSVDTGWITDERPLHHQIRSNFAFSPPLDCVDGAVRILDPIFTTLHQQREEEQANIFLNNPPKQREVPAFGQFFKDFQPTFW